MSTTTGHDLAVGEEGAYCRRCGGDGSDLTHLCPNPPLLPGPAHQVWIDPGPDYHAYVLVNDDTTEVLVSWHGDRPDHVEIAHRVNGWATWGPPQNAERRA